MTGFAHPVALCIILAVAIMLCGAAMWADHGDDKNAGA